MASPDSPSTSPTLLGFLAHSENDIAWRRFIALYTPLIDDWARLSGLRGADIDEIRSRVFAGLVTAFREFRYDPARRFRGYLRAAVNNATRTYFQQRKSRPGAVGVGGDGPGPLDEVATPDLGSQLDESLTADRRVAERVMERTRLRVSEKTWQVFWSTAIEGMPASDVAEKFGMSLAAVYVTRSRVAKMLLEEGRKILDVPPASKGENHDGPVSE